MKFLFTLIFAICCFTYSFGQVNANFDASPKQGCVPLVVNFTDSSSGTGSLTYLWDFGNGNTATIQTPSVNYVNPGVYTVTLIVSNGTSTDTEIKTGFITVYALPDANFAGVAPLSGCPPFNVMFNDSSIQGDGNISQWQWDFGDASPYSVSQNTSHTYSLIGNYTVSLQVTDEHGCKDDTTFQSYVNVANPPVIQFAADNTTFCSVPSSVNFTNNTTGTETITYLWSFGDGSDTTDANPTHTYTSPGTYDVSLTATDQYGCQSTLDSINCINITPVVALFHFNPDSVCPGQTVYFYNDADTTCSWLFGDGGSSSLSDPTHIYYASGNFTITFIAAPGTICQDTITDTITIRQLPVAAFSASTHYVCNNSMSVTFTDTSANSVSWNWSINGGTPSNSTSQNPTATYPNEGTFQTSLLIIDSYGCTSLPYTDLIPITVDFPTANINWNGLPNHCIPYDVAFTGSGTWNTTYDNVSNTGWYWTFGDGGNSNLQSPNYTYTTPGDYLVTLTVTTDSGCTAFDTIRIKVGSHQNPGISYTYAGGCANDESIPFFSNSTDTLLIDYWDWTFFSHFDTDSLFTVATSSLEDPIVDFHGNDSITIQYIIGYLECKDTLIDTNAFLLDGPFLQGIDTAFSCENPLHVGLTFAFIKQANRWYWDYNEDGVYDDSTIYAVPLYAYNDTIWHDFPSRGNYMVHLIAFNDLTGCFYEDSLTFTIYVIDAQVTTTSPHCYNNNYINISNSLDWPPNNNYTINYGDGQTIIYTTYYDSISHNYPATSGTNNYNIELIIHNFLGCTDTATTTIQIFQPTAGLSYSPDTICPPYSIMFVDTSSSDIPLVDWDWTFIGPVTLTSNGNDTANVNFTNPGTYTVQLLITDSIGCVSNAVGPVLNVLNFQSSFTSLDSTICKNDSVHFTSQVQYADTYIWNYGDGSAWDTTINPVHQYADSGKYTVSLIIQNSYTNCIDTLISNQYVDVQTITAQFIVATADTNCYPFSVTITNQTDTIFSPINWNWTFGDGGFGTQFKPSHNYTSPGNYSLILQATTPYGCTDKDTIMINVTGPYTDILVSDSIICKGDTVTFTLINNSGIYGLNWDFGDGYISNDTSTVITHIYNSVPLSGGYGPSLVYWGGSNQFCTQPPKSADSVFVYQVMADFTINGDTITSMCNPGYINFANTSFGPITSYNWYLGDGQYSSGYEPASPYTYYNTTTTDTTYYISLATTSTLGGCYDSIVKPFTVYHQPQITIGNDAAICYGSSVQLNASGGEAILWSPFQGLSNALDYLPTASPNSSTMYHATIYDTHTCTNSDSVFVFVQQIPQLFHNSDTTILIGDIVNMFASSDQSTVSYNWTPSYGLSCTSCSNPIAQPLVTTTYTVEIIDSLNCFHITSQVTIEVIEEFSIDVPTAFTPNNDGNNDLVFVRGWGIMNLLEFKIYNRWGECIFTTDDIRQGWDGTFKGMKQNIDSYAYTAKVETFNGKVLTKNGLINLLR